MLTQQPRRAISAIGVCVLSFAIASVTSQLSSAADSTADPALQKEAAVWKLKAEITDSKKKAQDAKYPKPAVTPLTGGFKAENAALIENTILAYCSLKNVTDRIAKDIEKNAGDFQKFLLLTVADVLWLQQYRAMMYELGNFRNGYNALNGDVKAAAGLESFAPPLAAAVAILGGVADLLALFRTNETLTGSNVTPDDMAVANSLSASLRALTTKKKLVWAGSIGFGVGNSASLASSDLAKEVTGLINLKDSISREIKRLADADARAPKVAKAKAKESEKPEQKTPSQADAFKARLDALNESFDSLVGTIRIADAKSGQVPLVMLLGAERVGKMIEGGTVAPMAIKVVAMGGNNLTTQNLFFGSHLYQSGGALVAYQIFNKNGDIVWENNIPGTTGYVEFERRTQADTGDLTGFENFCGATSRQ